VAVVGQKGVHRPLGDQVMMTPARRVQLVIRGMAGDESEQHRRRGALTRPVVIATSLIHRSWSFSSAEVPCPPTLATVPPGRMSSVAISKVAGAPTA
jgi:hypothetical protein